MVMFLLKMSNSFIRSENRLVVGFGIKDLCVIETDDSVLIASRKSLKSMKELIKELEDQNLQELYQTKKFTTLGALHFNYEGKLVSKKVVINPMESLSFRCINIDQKTGL